MKRKMYKVWYNKKYVGLVCATEKTVLKTAIGMMKSLAEYRKIDIVPDNIRVDDSQSDNYRHMIGD